MFVPLMASKEEFVIFSAVELYTVTVHPQNAISNFRNK